MSRWGGPVYILTNGWFWRPHARGFTASITEAGRWTKYTANKIGARLGPEKQFQVLEVVK